MEAAHALQPVILLLFVGILAIVLMRPLRLSPIVGYLIAGILIGPYGLGLIEESETTHLLAELGVVFLLFDIGLHFSFAHMWDVRRDILGLGPLQVGLCAMVFTGLASVFGFGLGVAIVIGTTLALSSTAVVVQTLAEQGKQNCPIGFSATAVLVFQDICAIFLLILAASLGNPEVSLGSALGAAVLKAVLAFAVTIIAGRYLIGPLLGWLAKPKHEEVFTAVALLIVLVTAAATGALGLSLTLGAFLGGMIIGETPYRHAVRTEVNPFRGLLLGFFFLTVGMSLDTAVLARDWPQIILLAVLLVACKAVLVYLAGLVLKLRLRSALQLGFLLSQGSEFAFVIFGMPAMERALGADLSANLISAVALSMALTPSLAVIGHLLARRIVNRQLEAETGADKVTTPQVAPVVIFGMGEVGRSVADALEAHGIDYTAIEMEHDRFIRANADGYPVAFGDIGDPRFMETLGMAQRPTIVITIKRYEVSRDLTPILRERYPNLTRFIGIENEQERDQFENLGMRAIVLRSIPKGLDLAVAVLKHHQVGDQKIHAWMREQQEQALAKDDAERTASQPA